MMRNHFVREASCLSLLGAIFLAVLITATLVQAGSTTQEDAKSDNTGTSEQELDLPLNLNSPGSIIERLRRDRERKEYLFQFPGVSRALRPWYDLKTDLDEKYGFRYGISYSTLYQIASDTFGPEGRSRQLRPGY